MSFRRFPLPVRDRGQVGLGHSSAKRDSDPVHRAAAEIVDRRAERKSRGHFRLPSVRLRLRSYKGPVSRYPLCVARSRAFAALAESPKWPLRSSDDATAPAHVPPPRRPGESRFRRAIDEAGRFWLLREKQPSSRRFFYRRFEAPIQSRDSWEPTPLPSARKGPAG